MAIPKQVQKQLDEAEALERQIFGDGQDTAVDPDKPVAEVKQPEAEQSADDTAEDTDAQVEDETVAEDEGETPEDSGSEIDPRDDDPAYWKQRYKTLQGMYDADVPRLNAQLKELASELESFKAEVNKANQKAEKAEAEKERLKNLVTDEDRQEFGEDLIEVQRKVAREELADLVEKVEELRSANAELRKQLDATGKTVNTASFEQRLERAIPGFHELNASPEWIAWLNEVDPMLRAPRMSAAQRAYSSGDVEGVAHYVRLFKESRKPVTKKKPSSELENQIQPSRSASTSQATPTPKGKVYTTSDIQKMFKRVTELGVAGRIDEARKLEAEIDAAYTQGRVAA